uniref:piggyBac transposable element-derived protein 4-like n=1 Tax=Maylandia zebra TaxID=106582 RepID=UPI000D30B98B|nr:piggyBac transposable element-derived protein 4-like [Maylandia zebra]
MARRYNTEEALQMILDPECEDSASSSTEDLGDDAEISSEEETEELESGSDSYGSESENESGEMEEESAGWISKNGTKWSPTNAETLRYVPAATGHTGPTFHATAGISDPQSSFSLFVTDEIILHIVSMTNIQGRRTIADWKDVDSDGLRAEVAFMQYVPKKPAKYGLKVWAVCDVETSYAWRLQLYTGKAVGGSEINQGMRVVLELTEGLQGHSVTCDNFFTSFPLSEELLRRKNTLVGTIRKNKPELPPQLLQTRGRGVFSVFAFTTTHTAVSYVPRCGRNVLLLSSKHRTPGVCDDPKRKPHIIKDYNKSKAVATYTCRRRTRRWPLALFHHLIDISLYNGYVLWTAVDPAWQQSKAYRRRLYIDFPALPICEKCAGCCCCWSLSRPLCSHQI